MHHVRSHGHPLALVAQQLHLHCHEASRANSHYESRSKTPSQTMSSLESSSL